MFRYFFRSTEKSSPIKSYKSKQTIDGLERKTKRESDVCSQNLMTRAAVRPLASNRTRLALCVSQSFCFSRGERKKYLKIENEYQTALSVNSSHSKNVSDSPRGINIYRAKKMCSRMYCAGCAYKKLFHVLHFFNYRRTRFD